MHAWDTKVGQLGIVGQPQKDKSGDLGMLTFPNKGFVDKGRETMLWGMDSVIEVEVGAQSYSKDLLSLWNRGF